MVKVGGSLLRDAASYVEAAAKIKELFAEEATSPFIVVSAVKGVTDALTQIARGSRETLNDVIERHLRIAEDLGGSRLFMRVVYELESLKKITSFTRHADSVVMDLIWSFGERLSKVIMLSTLELVGVRALELDARDVIVTDEIHGNATIDYESTLVNLERVRKQMRDCNAIPVIEGFVGLTTSGEVSTLGRGGSDYTATTIAALLRAETVFLVTNVDGILSSDPELVPTSRLVRFMNYDEASEASLHRVKNINPKAFRPLQEVYGSRVMVGSWRVFGTEIESRTRRCVEGPKVIGGNPTSDPYVAVIGEGVTRGGFVRKVIEVLNSNSLDITGLESRCGRPSLKIHVRREDWPDTLLVIHRGFIEGELE